MAFTSVKAIVLIQLLALVIGSSSKLSFGEVTENSSLYNHQDNKIISTKVRFSLGCFPKKSPSTPTPVKRPPPPSKSAPPPPSPPPPAQSPPPPPPSPPPPAQSPPPPPPPAQSPTPPASPPPTKSPPPPPPPPPPAQSPKQTPPPSPTAQPPANQPAPPPSQPPKLPPPLSPPDTQLPIGRPPQPSPPAQLPIRRPPPSPPTNQPPNKSSPPPPIEPPVDHEPPIIEPPPISHEPPFIEPPPTSQPPIVPFPPTLSPPFIPRITPPVKLPPPTIHPAGKLLIVVGRVNCKSCSSRVLPSLFKASPLHGASVKLVCHNNGRKANVQTALTDNNGDFSIIPISLARGDVHKCRVYLVKSPKPICSVPTNYNNGKSGAVLKPILPPGNHGPGPGPVFDFFGVGPFIFEAPNKFPCRK